MSGVASRVECCWKRMFFIVRKQWQQMAVDRKRKVFDASRTQNKVKNERDFESKQWLYDVCSTVLSINCFWQFGGNHILEVSEHRLLYFYLEAVDIFLGGTMYMPPKNVEKSEQSGGFHIFRDHVEKYWISPRGDQVVCKAKLIDLCLGWCILYS